MFVWDYVECGRSLIQLDCILWSHSVVVYLDWHTFYITENYWKILHLVYLDLAYWAFYHKFGDGENSPLRDYFFLKFRISQKVHNIIKMSFLNLSLDKVTFSLEFSRNAVLSINEVNLQNNLENIIFLFMKHYIYVVYINYILYSLSLCVRTILTSELSLGCSVTKVEWLKYSQTAFVWSSHLKRTWKPLEIYIVIYILRKHIFPPMKSGY